MGAAEYLGVSAPGVSRLIKHTEETLNLRLFERRSGLFVPSVEAQTVFDQIRAVYKGVENLQLSLESLQKGENVQLAFALPLPSPSSSPPVLCATCVPASPICISI
ncbi:LysR family transcriptional regulator [Celeribacter baekdonensis]|uniref:LysR family transcriptional regulator n=1 Tax=Celeribacter baekdonensis TaxID=875171 RepID=UPI0020C802B6|nr:LysR family transcriptional regulator [Celeribacter baekdonensis]